MKTKQLLMIFFLAFTLIAKAQTEFTIIVNPADSLREAGDLNGAIDAFRKTYSADPKNENNLYNFACALAVTNQRDSCFKYLYKSIELDTSTYALSDPDFLSLRDDKRWPEFEDRLISMVNIKTHNALKDIEFAKKLWRMKAKDQAFYTEIDIAEKKTGKNSTVVIALWKLKAIYNDENQQELEKLIAEKGWPKISAVGERAAGAAFLIIQHSDNEKQKKYLPTIEKLCKEKEANWQSYALMYDRIQIGDNKPQKYGSQIMYNNKTGKYELFPLLDETKVDQWRAEIGMQPLSKYASQWGITFEPQKK